jgi:hypothetical protein
VWFEDLPSYLPEQAPVTPKPPAIEVLRHAVVGYASGASASKRPQAGTSIPGGAIPRPSPIFARMVPLNPAQLREVLDDWWLSRAVSGKVVVHHRLQLGRPEPDGSTGLVMKGRVRRLTSLHWVSIVLELWPMYEQFTRLTMTPQSHVVASKRYFRVGHVVLDRLSSELIELADRRAVGPSSSS